MHKPPFSPQTLPAAFRRTTLILGLGCAVMAGSLRAADLPPELIGRLTLGVQPLLLNKCGAGACHGGPTAHEPRLRRPDVQGAIDRGGTLANLDTFLGLLGPDRDPQPLVELLAVQHPRAPANRRLVMKPLTPAERVAIESWVRAVADAVPSAHATIAAGRGNQAAEDRAVRQASHEEAADPSPPPRPNRFRVLLDTGAPPTAGVNREPTGRSEYTAILDKRKAAAADVTPGSARTAPLPETVDSPPARPDAPASPRPTSRESR
jgi:hypothetical protein